MGEVRLHSMGTPFLLVPSSLNQPVTYVPRLNCYLCLQSVPTCTPNSALVSDACGRRSRAYFNAAQRER